MTTFSSWTQKFENLSLNVTAVIYAGSPASRNPVPGGLLLAGFAVLGFVVAYLWMRRWFIGELVTAQNEQGALLIQRRAEQAKVASAQKDDRQGVGSSIANNPAASAQVASQMVATAADLFAGTAAQEQVAQIQSVVGQAPVSDDPWKGAFGGVAARNGCVLSANVSGLITDPNNFQVDLLVTAEDGMRDAFVGKIARFFLHPTFGSLPRDVKFDPDGKASLQIFSYGAFTVGVLIEDGTQLELDLAKIAGAPQLFVER